MITANTRTSIAMKISIHCLKLSLNDIVDDGSAESDLSAFLLEFGCCFLDDFRDVPRLFFDAILHVNRTKYTYLLCDVICVARAIQNSPFDYRIIIALFDVFPSKMFV
mmetsp:Transcript_21316/g.27505  ORF Transcript_21316/g.27505 Transcript_21316/m.27505 type:complete len:108 (-) Transcript_21316:88-411(-)